MYVDLQKINQVIEFKVNANLIVYKGIGKGRRNRSLFIYNNTQIDKLAEGVSGFQIEKNNIYYSNWNNESFKLDLKNRFLLKLEFNQVSIYKLNDFIFFYKEGKYHIMSGDENVISESTLGNKNILIDSNLFSTNSSNDKISSYNISHDEKLNWIIRLSQFGTFKDQWQEEKKVEVSCIIGIWQDQLLVSLNNGMFMGIHAKTGELLWNKSNVDLNETSQEINYGFGRPYNPFLDKERGLIYVLQGEIFIEFDLKNQEASYRWHSKDNIQEDNLFIKQSRIRGNLIYFTASIYPNLRADNTVGIFDISQNKIVWQYSFTFEKGVFIPNNQNNLQINDENLFVLDSRGTLHIFKKEKLNV